MTPAGELLRDEIARHGPVSFHRFMTVALYEPGCGYYRRGRDPFGRAGDYYTAAQLQPVFGILISTYLRALAEAEGAGPEPVIVELGAGRGEMREHFGGCRYLAVEHGDAPPERIRGAVFANEFFDALPVHVITRRGGSFYELLVGFAGGRFHWVEGGAAGAALAGYLDRHAAPLREGDRLEVNLDALAWIDRCASFLERGCLLAIDYGYTRDEIVRFPRGTLMSYRRHLALEDVLADPGERDITAHVCFSALADHAAARGFERVRFESLGRLLLRAGEGDQFAAALEASPETESRRRRLQLKTLLFGMGEAFRSLVLRKRSHGGGRA